MKNPNPRYITEPMWKLYTSCRIPGVTLSGIYANKKAYHNTVLANQKTWPGNYSIRLPLDLPKKAELLDVARAIDLTMSDKEMVKWTTRMKDAALNPQDHRLAVVREFYGTLDNKTVYGLIKDRLTGEWRRSTADLTHLWHGHTSIFTSFVDDWDALVGISSVWNGVSLEDYLGGPFMLPVQGDSGEVVKYWQYVHNRACAGIERSELSLKVDGDYGADTAAGFRAFAIAVGSDSSYQGNAMTGWLAMKYHQFFANISAPKNPVADLSVLEGIVNKYLDAQINKNLKIEGKVIFTDEN